MKKPIRVVIIDDSALVRSVLERILSKDPDIEVVGLARDPIEAIKVIKECRPDVLTLDLEMPKMDGLTFLRKLMKVIPLPVVVISSKVEKNNEATLMALELGAVDFVTKPAIAVGSGLEELEDLILEKIKDAAQVDRKKLRTIYMSKDRGSQAEQRAKRDQNESSLESIKSTDKLIAIGGSTGSTVAIRKILEQLPSNLPPIVIVIHMPAGFTKSYADGLDKSCSMRVKEASDKETVKFGYAYIAPGGRHLEIEKDSYQYKIKITDNPPVNRHRPSVDVMMETVATTAGSNAMGIILTGMGDDGAKGMKDMYNIGAYTIAQNEESSVVFGMPKQAIQQGAVREVCHLDDIAARIIDFIRS